MKYIWSIIIVSMLIFSYWVNQLPSPERRYNAAHEEIYTLWDGDKSVTFKVMFLQPEPLGDGWVIADEEQLQQIMENLHKSGFKAAYGTVIISGSAHIEAYHGYSTLFRNAYRFVNNKGDFEPDVIASDALKRKSFLVPNGWRVIAVKQSPVGAGEDSEALASTSLQ